MTEVICPKCGEKIRVKGTGGRKPKDLPVIFVCDKLQATRSVQQAAEELGCSRGYIYKVLKAAGLGMREVMAGQMNSEPTAGTGSMLYSITRTIPGEVDRFRLNI